MASPELQWDDLRYFLHAARLKSQAGAARALGVEHSTVGRRLMALERALGAPLVLRSSEGLRLTDLGEQIAPLVQELERLVGVIGHRAQTRSVRVRLAVPSGFTQLFVPKLAELTREHDQLSLEILSGSRVMDLRQGEADLAIRTGPLDDEDLMVRKLGDVGWALYAAPTYLARKPFERGPDDLSGHDLIAYDPSLLTLSPAQWIEQRSHSGRIVLRSRELTDMLIAVRAGGGLGLLPCLLGDAEPALERLTPSAVVSRRLSLVYRREAREARSIALVSRFVVRVIREHADLIAGLRPIRNAPSRRSRRASER